MLDWHRYLESIREKYAHWQDTYTVTDVVGRQKVEAQQSLIYDFDLMVQTVNSSKEELNQKQEKTERLGVLEGLRKYAKEHVLLVGRPGSGKSTALARLLLEEAGKLGVIPVLVELRYYQTSVLDLIRSFLKRHKLLLGKEEIERLLFDKQFLLLVDGVNELPSEEARRDLIAFRRENPETPMIFTTRDLGVGGDVNIAKKLEMQPLTDTQIQTFVNKYLPEQGEQMLRQLGTRLREFGETPLLLCMLCSVFIGTGKIPPNLGMVFREFTQFCENKRLEGVLVTDESRQWWRRLLQHLALKMTQASEPTELQVAIPKEEAQDILKEFLQQQGYHQPWKALEWLDDLLKYHLIQLGAENKIEFKHQLIQEYYTAESLLKQLSHFSDDKLKREYLNYLKWTEPLAVMLELLEEEKQALRVVKLALEVDLKLVARLAGAVKPEFQVQTVAWVVGLEVSQRLKVELLGITRSEYAVSPLQEALRDEDSSVRRSAAKRMF